MKVIIQESTVVALIVAFILAVLQPFGLEKAGDARLFVIVVNSLFSFVSSCLSFLLVKCLLNWSIEFSKKTSETLRGALCVSLVNAPILAFFTCCISYSWTAGGELFSAMYDSNGHFTMRLFGLALLEIFLLTPIILAVIFYRMRNRTLNIALADVRAINAKLEQRQEKLEQEREALEDRHEEEKCKIVGNTYQSVFEVYPSDIIYVESMSNYANVYYLEDEEVRKRSLRITMKQMKTTLADYDYLVSCHRAFLVNLNYVQSMKGRPSTGFELQMFGSDKTIPVSRTYSEDFKNQVTK